MANRNSEYWKKRFEQIEQAQNNIGVQCCADIEKQFRQAQRTLEGQISAWYQRFADNNGVSLSDARRMLTNRELEELKWDINQYIQYGEQNAISGTWVKQLENASARYHISRLEALKLQTQQSIEVLFGNQLDSIDSAMRGIYKSGYYHTAYEIQKGVGVGWNFATLDDKTISKVINKPWAADGRNFSDRVWSNKQKLVNELNTTLTQNIVLGQDPQKAIDTIAKRLNVSKNRAGALVMTEEAAFSSAAQKDCFAELDVEEYEIVATLDSHTSETCQDMDGRHFKMSEWEVGTTAPPFHVNCRTTTCPYFADMADVGERSARNADGKTYYVPADMTYREWEKTYVKDVDKPSESGIMENAAGISKKSRTATADNTVDIEYINSKEYKDKFDGLTEYSDETRKTLCRQARAMLTHRSKTDKEDMYLIDINSSGIVGKQTSSRIDFGVSYNDSLKKAVASAASHTLVSIHNHPTNLPPTGSDFASAGAHGYHSGVVVCHNGKVYWYKVSRYFKGILFDQRVAKYQRQPYNLTSSEAHIKALNDFVSEYGIDWREIK